MLQDVSIIKVDDKQYVVNKIKIKRERHKKYCDLKVQTNR